MIPLWVIKYTGVALILAGLLAFTHHHGVTAGKASRDAYWQPLFIAAEKAAAEANAKTAAVESAQEAITANAEARHVATVKDLSTRYAAANGRIRALSLRLQANSASRCAVSSVPDSPHELDGSSPSEERAFRVGDSLADIGR